jgi:hypothetical protein
MRTVMNGIREFSGRAFVPCKLTPCRLVIFELAQIRHAIRAERELTKGQSYSILWATPGNCKRMR